MVSDRATTTVGGIDRGDCSVMSRPKPITFARRLCKNGYRIIFRVYGENIENILTV